MLEIYQNSPGICLAWAKKMQVHPSIRLIGFFTWIRLIGFFALIGFFTLIGFFAS